MYSFKIKEAETAIREYQRRHPNSKATANAIIDGEFVPCEGEIEFECYLCMKDGAGV